MKTFFKNPIVMILSLYAIALLAWDAALFLNPVKTTLWNYYFSAGFGLIYVMAGIFGIIRARQFGFTSTFGKAVAFIGMALLCYGIGDYIWFYYTTFLQIEVPYPSFADLFWIMFFPLIIIGFSSFLTVFRQLITKRMVLQSGILILLAFTFSLAVIFKPDLSSDLSFLEKTLNAIYPAGDALLLSLIFITFQVSAPIAGGYFKKALLFFAVATIVQFLADVLFTYRSANDLYWNGDISDLTFMFAAYLFFLSLIYVMQKMGSPQLEKTEDVPMPSAWYTQGIVFPMTPYEEIADAIIQKLSLVLGKDIALARARNSAGLSINYKGRVEKISGDPTTALDGLLGQYQELLGPAAVSFAKIAALPISKKNPGLILPPMLQV